MSRRTGETDNWVLWRLRNEHESLGEFGECLWSRIFAAAGLFYVQLSTLPALNGRGPRLQNSGAILPDFDVSGRRRAYVDSKCKTKPVLYRKANELRHGIDRKCAESYATISGINQQKCVLAICELFCQDGYTWSGSLLMQTLATLGKPIAGFSSESHMVYWPRHKFAEVGCGSPADIWDAAKGNAQPDQMLCGAVNAVLSTPETIQARMF